MSDVEAAKRLPTKEDLTDEALKYDKKSQLTEEYEISPSTAFAKGLRRGITLSLPFIQDYFKGKIEKLIK